MLYQLIDMMIKQNFLNNIYFGVHFINPIMDLSWKVRQDIVLEPVKVLLVRDYCGNYEYENCRLVRIHIENGYIDGNGIYNAYIKDYQGNNRVTVSHTGQYFDVTNYYPYGMPYADLNGYDRYKYSGKEIETANGLNHYDFHARSHDFALGLFTGQDKKAVDYASVSPYTYCTADPINNIDPTGESPIYGMDGSFLGTDDNGLRGEYLIMPEELFVQSMKHTEAKDVAYYGTIKDEVRHKIWNHCASLYSRPDWDGKLTLSEANEWYRKGHGETLFVDIKSLDLSNFYSLGEEYVGKTYIYNLLIYGKPSDGLVFGSITFERTPNHGVRAYKDYYDFDIKKWSGMNIIRNIETYIGEWVAGSGTPYYIVIYGEQKLKPILPWLK